MRLKLRLAGLILLALILPSLVQAQPQWHAVNPLPWLQVHNHQLANAEFTACNYQVRKALGLLPEKHWQVLTELHLHQDQTVRRGLAGDHMIYLRCDLPAEEIISVFIHEMGHLVDLSLLEPREQIQLSGFWNGTDPIYETDPSLLFYRLSWLDSTTVRSESHTDDFVTGYAQENPFEDFAESSIFYVLHGEKFRYLMTKSPILQAKYDFLKYYVFSGSEFNLEDKQSVLTSRVAIDRIEARYDATRLSY